MSRQTNQEILFNLKEDMKSLPNTRVIDNWPVNGYGGFLVMCTTADCNARVLIDHESRVTVAVDLDDISPLIVPNAYVGSKVAMMMVTHPNNPSRKHMISGQNDAGLNQVCFQTKTYDYTFFRQSLCKMLVSDMFEHAENKVLIEGLRVAALETKALYDVLEGASFDMDCF